MLNVNVNFFSSALNSLKISAFKQSPIETGGVMVGTRSWHDDNLEFNILGVLGVGDFTEFKHIYTASPNEFICTDRLGWANLALKAVKTFGMSYIGDWHSHPESSLTHLSRRDIHGLAKQYNLGQFAPFPPLHILLNWQTTIDCNISAYIILGDFILCIEPRIID